MQWIERIFGVSPDGGSGALEFLLLAIPAIGLYLTCKARPMRSKRKARPA
jgi:hypothetical protein